MREEESSIILSLKNTLDRCISKSPYLQKYQQPQILLFSPLYSPIDNYNHLSPLTF